MAYQKLQTTNPRAWGGLSPLHTAEMTARCFFVFVYTFLCCTLSAFTAFLPEDSEEKASSLSESATGPQVLEDLVERGEKHHKKGPAGIGNDGVAVVAHATDSKPSEEQNGRGQEEEQLQEQLQAAAGPQLRRLNGGKASGRKMNGLGRGFGAALM